MDEENKDLDSQATEDEVQVLDGEENSQSEELAPEGTEAEGSEAEVSSEDSQSEGRSDQEADKSKGNKRSAQHRISNRIKKLKGDLTQSESGKQVLENQLAVANQRIEILQLSNSQRVNPAKPVEPSPDSFDGGVHDPEYVKKYQAYLKSENQQEIQREVAKQAKTNNDTHASANLLRDTERKQRDHYRRAIKGNSDYEDKEDTLKEILGTEAIKDIIANFDDSDKIIYQLGADEDMAIDVADAIENNDHVLAVRLLERASKGLKIKPKTKITPNPDTPLAGGSPSGNNDTDKRAEQLLKKATDSGSKADLNKYLDHQANRRKEKARAG